MGSWKDIVLYPIPDYVSSLVTLSPFAVVFFMLFLAIHGAACFFLFNYMSYFALGGLGLLFVVTYIQMIFHKGICRFQSFPRLFVMLCELIAPIVANLTGVPTWRLIVPKSFYLFSWAVVLTACVATTLCYDISEIIRWFWFKERQVFYGRWTTDRLLKKSTKGDWFIKQEIKELNAKLAKDAELQKVNVVNHHHMFSTADMSVASPRNALSPVSPRYNMSPRAVSPTAASPRSEAALSPRAAEMFGDFGVTAATMYAPRAVYQNGQIYKPKPVAVALPPPVASPTNAVLSPRQLKSPRVKSPMAPPTGTVKSTRGGPETAGIAANRFLM